MVKTRSIASQFVPYVFPDARATYEQITPPPKLPSPPKMFLKRILVLSKFKPNRVATNLVLNLVPLWRAMRLQIDDATSYCILEQ
jgi:hypothetical protein